MNTSYANYVEILSRGHLFDEMKPNVPPEALIDLGLDPIIAASRDLDDAKKHLFYGKPDRFWGQGGHSVENPPLSYDVVPTNVLHAIVGVCAEAGELAELLKEALEGRREIDVKALILEAGDVCWYLQLLANSLEIEHTVFVSENVKKLSARYGMAFTPEKALARSDLAATN